MSASRPLPQVKRVSAGFAVVVALLLFGLTVPAAADAAFPITVNNTRDEVDTNPGNGECRTFSGAGQCSLRAAIQEANASLGADTIYILPGVYELEVPTLNEDLPETGDYDIHGSLTIAKASGPGVPVGDVIIDGGAIQNWSSGIVRVENSKVLKNLATGAGGGINNADPFDYDWLPTDPIPMPLSGRVDIVNSTLSGNGSGAGGAAVNNTSSGTVTIAGSRVTDNPGQMIVDPASITLIPDPANPGQLIPDPTEPPELIPAPGVYEPTSPPIANQGQYDGLGTIRIASSVVSDNYSEHDGGAVANEGDGALVVEDSEIENNTSEASGGGIFSHGGTLTVTDSAVSGNEAADGGGIYSVGASSAIGLRPRITITGTTISDNTAAGPYGLPPIDTTTPIIGNVALPSGGGILNDGDGHMTLTDVTLGANKAGDDGGGLNNQGRATLVATRVKFLNNEAHNEGGGAWSASERLATIRDSTFSGNKGGVPDLTDPAEPLPVGVPGEARFSTVGNVAGGGGLYTEGGPVDISRSTFTGNTATEEGGGISIDNFGDVTIKDSLVTENAAGADGGGIENSGFRVTFERLRVIKNRATLDGGGIFSLADGDSLIESTTISGNSAATGGGGLFHDADGELKLNNLTIWRNSAPRGGGIGVVESDFSPEVPPKANVAVIVRNSIVGGSLRGGSCDWFVTSDGGNMDTGGLQEVPPLAEPPLPAETKCFLAVPANSDSTSTARRDRFNKNFTIDAIADNGGPTMTHRLNYGSLAIDAAVTPCPETDQRGTTRPQNGRCDMGAFEFVGPPPPADDVPPDTKYLSGPIQDTPETVQYRFTGSDNQTAVEDLNYECRVLEIDLIEEPEVLAPWDPVPPEEQWVGCNSPYQGLLIEEGLFRFEVRAVDRADNTDPTPAVHDIPPQEEPPDTIIVEKPPPISNSRVATFTFSGTDAMTPAAFMEYECRIDSRDPDLWLECLNPTIFSNLTSGEHMIEVRAINGAELTDPTPARYKWTVGQLPNCDQANITLTAVADGWADQVNPLNNYLFETELSVASGSTGDPTAVPPEQVLGQNARTLYRFALPTDANGCELESARLRLFNESPEHGRDIEVRRLAAPWKESTLTWFNQPGTMGTGISSPTLLTEGYQEWSVLPHVQAMTAPGGVNHGWQLRDAHENDPEGAEQTYISREMPQDPPPATLPQLVLRYKADAGPPPPAPVPATTETEVTCGQVLKVSTKLANDLHGCPGEGLVVGAPNIVVDLNGHTIHPPAVFVDPGEEDGLLAGVRNSGNKNVVIRNGTVKGYGYGVLLTGGTTHNVIEDMTLDANLLGGIELNDADDGRNGNIIQDNFLTSNGESAISLINGAENSVIRRNRLDGNGGVGFQLIEADGHLFQDNVMSGVPLSPLIDSDAGTNLEHSSDNVFRNNTFKDFGDAGFVVTLGSHRNLVEGNTMVRNGDAGVYVQDSDGNRVIGNIAHQSSDGGVVISNGSDSGVRGNDVRFNPSGVDLSNSNGAMIEDNNASNSLASGFEIGNGVNLTIRNNVANHSGGGGIPMEGGAFGALRLPVGGALIEGNTANENAETGITVADGGHTVRDHR